MKLLLILISDITHSITYKKQKKDIEYSHFLIHVSFLEFLRKKPVVCGTRVSNLLPKASQSAAYSLGKEVSR